MEFKKKFKSILQKEKVQKVLHPRNSSDNLIPPNFKILPVARDSESELRTLSSDPEADELILNNCDPLYFTSGGNFDPSLHVLQQLPAEFDREYINGARQKLLKELTIVSKKVFQAILQNQGSYTGEIRKVKEVEDELDTAIFVCQSSRADLGLAKQYFTTKSLGILANYRKRQLATNLLKYLKNIQTLQKTTIRLQELLSENEYPIAIQLLLECQQASITYNNFTCISELSNKLQETLENAEEQLDVSLSKVCLDFDKKLYSKLQKAYELLGKNQTCMDQLLMHFASAIHNTAFSVVYGFAELCRSEDQPAFNLQRKQYQDLCSCLTMEIFIPCLIDLCKALWKILLSYNSVIKWHTSQPKIQEVTEDGEELEDNQDYIEQKLLNGATHIWQDIQTKIKTFLLAFDFTGFKIDEFNQLLSIIHHLKAIGVEFCNSESESLQDCIRKACLRYFRRYHLVKLEELRIFLENEGFEICPVRSDFDVTKLQEFKFLQDDSTSAKLTYETDLNERKSIFERFSDSTISPFEIKKELSDENIYENSICKEDNENDGSSEEDSTSSEQEEKIKNEPPIITNTVLSILRLFGRYLHLMHLFKSIAYDVAVCMNQLFEFYFYSVFQFFATENGQVTIELISNTQLRLALTRVRDTLIKKENETNSDRKVAQPFISSGLNLKDEETLYGLNYRIIASESTVYLASLLNKLKPYIECHIPQNNLESILQLTDQAIVVSAELRRPIYAPITCKALDYSLILSQMDKVNWEVKEIMTQHSEYIDHSLRGLQIFLMRMERASVNVNIPAQVHSVIWEQIFRFCSRTFVDGFSNAKKCSQGGRGLMQLDFMQFYSKLEKISPISLKGFSDREYVESYVKAYYMPDTIMEEWIQKHSDYSGKQLISLVNCALQGNKKSKQRLISMIEEMEKSRR